MREVSVRLDKVQHAQVEVYSEGDRVHRCVTFTVDDSMLQELEKMLAVIKSDLARQYG